MVCKAVENAMLFLEALICMALHWSLYLLFYPTIFSFMLTLKSILNE